MNSDLGDDMALIEYVLGCGLIVLTHTEVPEQYEGQGIGMNWCRPYRKTHPHKRNWRSSRNARLSRPISAAAIPNDGSRIDR